MYLSHSIHFILLCFSSSAKWASVDGILYNPQGAVILDVVNDYPVFTCINALYIVDCVGFLNVLFLNITLHIS